MAGKDQARVDRRSFLRAAGGASSVALAAAAAPLAATPAEAYDPGPDETKARYNPNSPDVKTFYLVNGYESLKK